MCDPQRLTDQHLTTLARLGLRASAQNSGRAVLFRRGETMYELRNHAPGDPELVRLVVAFDRSDDLPAIDIAAVAAAVNARTAAAKVIYTDSAVVAVSDHIAGPPDCIPTQEQLLAILPRAIRALDHAMATVQEELALHGILTASAARPPAAAAGTDEER